MQVWGLTHTLMLSELPVGRGQVTVEEWAGGDGKAHLGDRLGRTAAAWQSFQGCPSLIPLLVLPGEAGRVLQTEDLVLELELEVAATDVQQIYRVDAYTQRKELHEVESLTV